jgi:SAM-dependent methyltransferase
MDCIFNEDYYERGIETGISGYSNFRWIPELTLPLCFRIIEVLNIHPNDKILDFGCAKGYLVRGFRLLHRQAWGVDVSQYAIEQAPAEVRQYLHLVEGDDPIPLIDSYEYTWIIAKDVLEHIPYEKLPSVLDRLREAGQGMFVVVPLGENGKYEVPAYEHDITHVIREPLTWWADTFRRHGFEVRSADYRVKHIKENWSQWRMGNGFFVLK